MTHDYPELDDKVRVAFFRIIERLGGTPPTRQRSYSDSAQSEIPQMDATVASDLAHRLLQLSKLEPQPRGYAFEKFLKDMFDAYGLSARASFRLVGEQIDGSFVSEGDTYLLEARWRNNLVDATTLRAFNAKVEDKASWSRGLLLSLAGSPQMGSPPSGVVRASSVWMVGISMTSYHVGSISRLYSPLRLGGLPKQDNLS